MDEFEKWLEDNRKESKRVADMADEENDIDQAFVSVTETRVYREVLEKYRTLKAKDEPLAVQVPTPAYLKAQKLIWDEAIKEHQKLYRENQRMQCEIEALRNSKGDTNEKNT